MLAQACVQGGIEVQTRQVMKNICAALALAGCALEDVCKTTVWLQDARDFGSFNRVYMSYFGAGKPARSTTEARLMVDAWLEIDVVAYKPRAKRHRNPSGPPRLPDFQGFHAIVQ